MPGQWCNGASMVMIKFRLKMSLIVSIFDTQCNGAIDQ